MARMPRLDLRCGLGQCQPLSTCLECQLVECVPQVLGGVLVVAFHDEGECRIEAVLHPDVTERHLRALVKVAVQV